MKVWVTKYALTTGVFCVEGEVSSDHPGMCTVKRPGYMRQTFHGDEWHKTEEDARAQFYVMVTKRQASLQKSIVKLANISFMVKEL